MPASPLLRKLNMLSLMTLVLAGCSIPGGASTGLRSSPSPTGPSPAASASAPTPSPSASTTPSPVSGPAGVLLQATPAGTYSLTLVFAVGHVVGPVDAHARSVQGNGAAAPAAIPLFSASSARLYYLDGDNAVRYLALDGSSGNATQVPGSAHSQSGFAVSPDDLRIAVATIDYTTNPPTLHLVVEDLGGAHRSEIFTSTTNYVWPVGWHAGQLVLAVGSAFTQNVASNPYGTFSGYHVVNATTANRTFAIDCDPGGPLTPAGTACLGGGVPLITIDFSGNPRRLFTSTPLGAAVSPDGNHVVYCCSSGQLQLWDTVAGSTKPLGPAAGPANGWIDNTHALSEGSLSPQPQVIDITTGKTTAVSALGEVVGRIPGDL